MQRYLCDLIHCLLYPCQMKSRFWKNICTKNRVGPCVVMLEKHCKRCNIWMVVITGLAVIHCCTNCKTEWRQKFMIKVADASAQTKVRGTFIVGKQIPKMITSGFLRTRLTFIKNIFAHANRVFWNNRNFSRKVNYKNTKEIEMYVIEQKRLLDHLVTLLQKNRNGKLLQINGCIYGCNSFINSWSYEAGTLMQYRWTFIYRRHPTNILARAQNEIREKQQGILKTLWPIHKVSEFRVQNSLSEIVIQHYYQKNMGSIHNNDRIFRKFLDWKTKGGNRIINCCSKC